MSERIQQPISRKLLQEILEGSRKHEQVNTKAVKKGDFVTFFSANPIVNTIVENRPDADAIFATVEVTNVEKNTDIRNALVYWDEVKEAGLDRDLAHPQPD